MAALTRLKLSSAYPAMSLNFVIPVLLSGWLLHEDMTARRIAGIGLIVLGTLHATR